MQYFTVFYFPYMGKGLFFSITYWQVTPLVAKETLLIFVHQSK